MLMITSEIRYIISSTTTIAMVGIVLLVVMVMFWLLEVEKLSCALLVDLAVLLIAANSTAFCDY